VGINSLTKFYIYNIKNNIYIYTFTISVKLHIYNCAHIYIYFKYFLCEIYQNTFYHLLNSEIKYLIPKPP
jgi:hypothetical protein